MGRSCIHGQSGVNRTKEYIAWGNIIDRCENKTHKHYEKYGGRGIVICDRWRNSYELFLDDMGAAPSKKHSIERLNVDGNYDPTNCVWATAKEQANNRRNNVIAEYNGESNTLMYWCEKLGLKYSRVNWAINNNGKTLEQVVSEKLYLPEYRQLNKGEVVILKTFINAGIGFKLISEAFGIKKDIVWRLATGRSFRHINGIQ